MDLVEKPEALFEPALGLELRLVIATQMRIVLIRNELNSELNNQKGSLERSPPHSMQTCNIFLEYSNVKVQFPLETIFINLCCN